jgi:hypothetical protein
LGILKESYGLVHSYILVTLKESYGLVHSYILVTLMGSYGLVHSYILVILMGSYGLVHSYILVTLKESYELVHSYILVTLKESFKKRHLLFTCFILIFYRRDNRFECLSRAIQNNRLCQPVSIRRVWRYQRVIIIRTSKNRQHNGQKNRQHNGQQKKVQKDKQRSTEHTYKTKDRETRTPGQSSDLKRSYVISIRIEMMHRRNKSCDILTLVTLFSLHLSRAIARV